MNKHIEELSIEELDIVSGGAEADSSDADNVTTGVTLAAIGTVAVAVGLAVPTGGASLVAVGSFLTAGGWFVASGD